MNDKFLARGKRNRFDGWIEGYYVPLDNKYSYMCTWELNVNIKVPNIRLVSVDLKTVGRFTGLTDKNEVKIFEGDIVSVNHPYNGKSTHEVIWDKYCWNLKNFYASCFEYPSKAFSEGTEYMTVIGNIHDNPELLKESEKN